MHTAGWPQDNGVHCDQPMSGYRIAGWLQDNGVHCDQPMSGYRIAGWSQDNGVHCDQPMSGHYIACNKYCGQQQKKNFRKGLFAGTFKEYSQ